MRVSNFVLSGRLKRHVKADIDFFFIIVGHTTNHDQAYLHHCLQVTDERLGISVVKGAFQSVEL